MLLAALARHARKHPKPVSLGVSTCCFLILVLVAAAIIEILEFPAEQAALVESQGKWDVIEQERADAIAAISAATNDATILGHLAALNSSILNLHGGRPDLSHLNWTFMGSLYFIFTLVTTIGYGTFAPQTAGGRAFSVFMCLFGTGAFAYFVACLSVIVNVGTTWLAKKLRIESNTRRAALTLLVICLYWLVGALVFDAVALFVEGESWGVPVSLYYAAITFTTVGLGDYSLRWFGPLRGLEVIVFIVFTTVGLVLFIEVGNIVVDEIARSRKVVEASVKSVSSKVLVAHSEPADSSSEVALAAAPHEEGDVDAQEQPGAGPPASAS